MMPLDIFAAADAAARRLRTRYADIIASSAISTLLVLPPALSSAATLSLIFHLMPALCAAMRHFSPVMPPDFSMSPS